ncbi:M48 family metallopeptidase [Tateyamaria sp. SN6-1]|uniref:M48 family metallopeptidase n=1 Tax=Tateyamaria sp. SN6-1 TaxID=3092148 RepID=UPI0039F4A9B6
MAHHTLMRARFFDGEQGLRLDVDLQVDTAAETLRLTHPDLPMGSQYWPLWAIRALSDQAREDQMVLTLVADEALDSSLITTARLTVDEPEMISILTRLCPDLKKKDIARGTLRKVVTWTGGAVGALALMIFVILPAMANTLAAYIPIEREVAWGKTVVGGMERFLGGTGAGSLVCQNAEGLAALTAMTDRLTERSELEYELTIAVFDHPMVNAFAAPGGHVVLMRGLIEKADSPDEVAAVLGHEIGHVESRDVTRNALRSAGSAGLLSLVLGDFAGGGAAVLIAEWTLNASYTREAEAAADVYALEMLERSGTDASGMADFFDKIAHLQDRGGSMPAFLASHPDSHARAASARAFAENQRYGTRPILSAREWTALQNICDD